MNQEVINKILEVSGDFIKNMDTTLPGLYQEIINYFIFLSVMSIVKNLFFLLLVGLFYRILSAQITGLEIEKKTYTKDHEVLRQLNGSVTSLSLFRNLGALAAIVYLLVVSYPHIEDIGKALYAPRLFIAEKAKDLVAITKK